ncbi:MAG TPA: class I SAM-dependent methyltransferase [Thermodesulfobacteriota bacterium]|nr:class I SAM-dependent methyltransferase [Thermodesulfobacteriota bacterium]
MHQKKQTSTEVINQVRDAFVERLLKSASGVFDIFTIYIGDMLGFYKALAKHGPLTSSELASKTDTHERYVREWLEQQTVAGILQVQNPEADAEHRKFKIHPGHAEVLVERDSLNYLAPLAQITIGAVKPLESLLNAYRTGGGVPYNEYGANLYEGQAGMNRAMFLQQLGTEWLPAIPGLKTRLESDPPARIADIGCGAGWSSIGIAKTYPKVLVDGFDLDEPSVLLARKNAEEAGVSDRVKFQIRDAGDPTVAGNYDLVTAFECVHDMSNPVTALRGMRNLTNEKGVVLVMDERVEERFTPEGNDVEWFFYGFSVLHCLPVGMAEQPSAGTGAVMRPGILKRYAEEAGFKGVEILPIENFFFRFYRLIK